MAFSGLKSKSKLRQRVPDGVEQHSISWSRGRCIVRTGRSAEGHAGIQVVGGKLKMDIESSRETGFVYDNLIGQDRKLPAQA